MMVLKPDIALLHVLIDELARRASGKLPAVWSLKVGEFLNDDLGVGRALGLASIHRSAGTSQWTRLHALINQVADCSKGYYRQHNQEYGLKLILTLTLVSHFCAFAH
jgi:hypothetical protein